MKIKAGFIAREIAGETVVLPIGEALEATKSIFTLNDTGAVIWKKLEEGTDINAIVDCICNEYDAPSEIVEQDVLEYLTFLKSKNMIE